jgi:hypothetical protein
MCPTCPYYFFLSTFGLFGFWALTFYIKTRNQVLVTRNDVRYFFWTFLAVRVHEPICTRIDHFDTQISTARHFLACKSFTMLVWSNTRTIGPPTHSSHSIGWYNTTCKFLVNAAGTNIAQQSTTEKGRMMIPTKDWSLFFCRWWDFIISLSSNCWRQ